MLSIIKTAIITIIISFISGVLLDNYKNLAPRILCTMKKAVPIRVNNKRVRVYNLRVKNTSNKTIRNLSLNLQGHNDNMKIKDARITKGLKFNLLSEDNIYNVSIPFLSKDDEFSVTLMLDLNREHNKKPIVTLRSPENFKKVYSEKQNGFLSSFLSMNDLFSNQNSNSRKTNNDSKEINSSGKSFFKYTKAMLGIASIIIVIYIGVWGLKYYNSEVKMLNGPNEKPTTNEQLDNNDINETQNTASNAEENKKATDKSNKQSEVNKKQDTSASNSKENTNSNSKNNTSSVNKSKSKSSKNEQNINSDENAKNTEVDKTNNNEVKNENNNENNNVKNNEQNNNQPPENNEKKNNETQPEKTTPNPSDGPKSYSNEEGPQTINK